MQNFLPKITLFHKTIKKSLSYGAVLNEHTVYVYIEIDRYKHKKDDEGTKQGVRC